jgi:hypothetical protein
LGDLAKQTFGGAEGDTVNVVPVVVPVTLPGLRKQALTWAVVDGSKVLAAFATEHAATAYRMRLASIRREMRV